MELLAGSLNMDPSIRRFDCMKALWPSSRCQWVVTAVGAAFVVLSLCPIKGAWKLPLLLVGLVVINGTAAYGVYMKYRAFKNDGMNPSTQMKSIRTTIDVDDSWRAETSRATGDL
jgi:hypothetical protein